MSAQKKVAVVTGAANGIGEATSRLLAERNYAVAMLDVSDFDELAAGLLAPTRHMWFIVKE